MPTALVTGATAGIGAAFVRRLSAAGYDLVLAARDEDRMNELAAGLPRKAEIIKADLATGDGMAAVEDRCHDGVDMLVNNAGFGHREPFLDVSAEKEVTMLRLHCETVLRTTLAALPGMVRRGRGDVVNVSSVAAFFAGGTYAASKAWVVTFSQSAATEVAAKGVRVMALCPGFTRTEFHRRAGMDMSRLPSFMWMSADAVVAEGLRDLRRGRPVSVPGALYKALVGVGRLVPVSVSSRMSVAINRRRLRHSGDTGG